MSKTQLPNWTCQLRMAYRNSSRQRRFTYKQNAVKIEQERANNLYDLKNEQTQQKTVILPARLETMSVAHLQAVLWEDTVQRQAVELRFEVRDAHRYQSQSINDWVTIRKFFKNRIAPVYSSTETKGTYMKDGKDGKNWDRFLKLTTSEGEHFEVLWPPFEFSLACRAIGVTDSESYDKLRHQTTHHPVTGDALPFLKIPDNSDVKANFIALAPQLDWPRCKPVANSLGAAAVIPSRCCNSAEILKVKMCCVNQDYVETKKNRLIPLRPAEGFKSDLKSTSRVFKALETGSFFSSGSMKKSMCSADILRATVLSNNITEYQLKAEYCKISVLYSIFENMQRLRRRLRNVELDSKALNLTSWDAQILADLEELNEGYSDRDINNLVKAKGYFDSFLARLNTYNVILNAELRGAAKSASKPNFERQNTMIQVLGTVFSECSAIKSLYPNLFFEFRRATRNLDSVTSPSQDLKNKEEGSRMVETIRAILEFENEVLGPDDTPRGHRLVLLVPEPLAPDTARLYQFCTRLELQITTSLDAVRKVDNSECIQKKSIDYDTNIYLYEEKRLDSNVSELLESLAKDAASS
ncbi:LAFA_0A07514g1_1 [Lachancea sp. 'fantastica']|nr:LAFA_0A07514g1_1 [Lachancea sp. 'fantastica']